jgi:hypothetical protein
LPVHSVSSRDRSCRLQRILRIASGLRVSTCETLPRMPERPHLETPPPPPRSTPLSVHRAFVVRLYASFDPASDSVSGLVEHVVTGSGGEFRSVQELLRLMRLVLDAHNAEPGHSEESR